MKIISLTCTNCGADLTIEEGRKDCYCSYCGHHMLVDDGVKEIIHRKIDEARIKEAEVDLARAELEKKNQRLKNITNVIKYILFSAIGIYACCSLDIRVWSGIIILGIPALMIVIIYIFWQMEKDKY